MRIAFIILLTLVSLAVQAQKTVITTNSLPLGIKVRKPEYVLSSNIQGVFSSDTTNSHEFYDIATLCDGFNDYGIPKNLVLPIGAQIILFLPSVKKNRPYYTYTYYDSDTRPQRLSNYNYVHHGDSVAYLGARVYSAGASERIMVRRVEANGRDGQPSIEFKFRTDWSTPQILGVTDPDGTDEVIQRYEDILQYEKRQYAVWLNQGKTDSLDQRGLPIDLELPASSQLDIRTSSQSESVVFKLYRRDDRSWTEYDPWEIDKTYYSTSKLSAGRYQIVLEERNKKYGEKVAIFSFTILPSPWSMPVNWLLGVIGLLLAGFISYRIIARRRLKKMEATKRLTEAELKAIRAQLNPHFLFNALNAIQNLVNKNDTEAANHYIVKLSRLMRLVLNQSSESFHSLAYEIEIAELYLNLEKMRSPFEYQLQIDEQVDQNMLVPTMLLQPYLENAVIHGVLDNEASQISVEIKLEGTSCLFIVKDNGQGTSTKKGNGKAMAMSQERLRVIENQHKVKTAVETKNTAAGFEVNIQIPTDL